MSLLEAYGVVLTDKFKTLWRTFELCKDAYFVDYVGRKQEAHEEDKSSTPSFIIDKLLNFALDNYTDRYCIYNHVWGLLSKREEGFFALAAAVTTLKGKLKLAEKISKNQKPNRGGGYSAQKYRTGDKRD